MTVQLATNPQAHAVAKGRKHSAAEGLAILGIGGAAMGFGVYELLFRGGSSGTPTTHHGTGYTPTPFTIVQATSAAGVAQPPLVIDAAGKGHPIPDQPTAATCDYLLDTVLTIAIDDYIAIPIGSPVSASACYAGPGQLIQSTSAAGVLQPVCVIGGNGVKYPIPDQAAAAACNMDLALTLTVPISTYIAIPTGPAMSGFCVDAYTPAGFSAGGGPGRSPMSHHRMGSRRRR